MEGEKHVIGAKILTGFVTWIMAVTALLAIPASGQTTIDPIVFSSGDIYIEQDTFGMPTAISVDLTNVGITTVSSVTVNFWYTAPGTVDPVMVEQQVVDVPVEGLTVTTQAINLPSAGIYTLEVFAFYTYQNTNLDTSATTQVTMKTPPDIGVLGTEISYLPEIVLDGSDVRFEATLWNYGEAPATSARVTFYDMQSAFCATVVTNIPGYDPLNPGTNCVKVYADWNTEGQHGNHKIFVVVSDVEPIEMYVGNNEASTIVPVYNEAYDIFVDGSATHPSSVYSYEFARNCFITITNGESTVGEMGIVDNLGMGFKIKQDWANQFSIAVRMNGKLTISNSKVYSDFPMDIMLYEDATLVIEDSNVEMNIVCAGRATVEISDSYFKGSLSGIASNINISNTHMIGNIEVASEKMNVYSSIIESNATVKVKDTLLQCSDTVFKNTFMIMDSGASQIAGLGLYGTTEAYLLNVSFISSRYSEDPARFERIWAYDSAKAYISRYLEVLVQDSTSKPVSDSTVTIKDYKGTFAPIMAVETDAHGIARFSILTDIVNNSLNPRVIHIGVYLVEVQASDPIDVYTITDSVLLPMYPNMTVAQNTVHKTIIVPPLDMDTSSTPGENDVVVPESPDSTPVQFISAFKGDGNLTIEGIVVLENIVPFNFDQGSAFQYHILIKGNGKLIMKNSTLDSPYPFNLYIYGNGSIEMYNSELVLSSGSSGGAIIAKENSAITMESSSIESNAWLDVTKFVTSEGSDIVGETFEIEADELTFGETDVVGDIVKLNSSALTVTDSSIKADALILTGNMAIITSTTFDTESVLYWFNMTEMKACDIYADEQFIRSSTFTAIDTDFEQPFDDLAGTDSGMLQNVNTPYVTVSDEATVSRAWMLSINVADSAKSNVVGAVVKVYKYNGTEQVGSDYLTDSEGYVQLALTSNITTSHSDIFVGNYKVIVSSSSGQLPTTYMIPQEPRYGLVPASGMLAVVMDKNKDLMLSYDEVVIPPTTIIAKSVVYTGLNNTNTMMLDISNYYSDIKLDNKTSNMTSDLASVAFLEHLKDAYDWPDYKNITFSNATVYGNSTCTVYGYAYYDIGKPVRLVASGSKVTVSFSPALSLNTTVNEFGWFNLTIKVPSEGPKYYNLTVTICSSEWASVRTDIRIPLFVEAEIPTSIYATVNTDKSTYYVNEKMTVTGDVKYNTNYPVTDASVTIFIGDSTVSTTLNSMGSYSSMPIKLKKAQTVKVQVTVTTPSGLTTTVMSDYISIKPSQDTTNPMMIAVLVVVIVAIAGGLGGFAIYYAKSSWGKFVECGECGAFIPENTKKCPNCGTDFEEEIAKCSVCEAWVPATSVQCPECGVPFKKKAEEKKPEGGEDGKPSEAKDDVPVDLGLMDDKSTKGNGSKPKKAKK